MNIAESQPTVYMMVGIPYSGKSTWIRKNIKPGEILVDIDSIIENYAAENGISYTNAFPRYVDEAQKEMYRRAKKAITQKQNVYWDNTNMTMKSRARKLNLFPKEYRKIAVVLDQPNDEEMKIRNKKRPDKVISKSIIEGMTSMYQEPSLQEGFDEIISVGYERI